MEFSCLNIHIICLIILFVLISNINITDEHVKLMMYIIMYFGYSQLDEVDISKKSQKYSSLPTVVSISIYICISICTYACINTLPNMQWLVF